MLFYQAKIFLADKSDNHYISMFLHSVDIQEEALVADIVTSDYRTADVFNKYGIDYCSDGNQPVSAACQLKGLNFQEVIKEQKNEQCNF